MDVVQAGVAEAACQISINAGDEEEAMSEERWADELLPDQPKWVRDLIAEELARNDAEIERLQKQIFALRASEIANQTLYRETKRMAGVEANNERLQARVAEAADEIARLRAQVESLSEQLTMESIDTTCHCAAKSAADCGCPGAVWQEDVLRAENGRLREALRTARDGLAHIKAVARLHAEGADTALEGRS